MQAKKYVESLPIEIRPIRGTNGETHRLQLYIKQFPDHDLSPKARQSNVEVDKKFHLFFEQRKADFGQGECMTMEDIEREQPVSAGTTSAWRLKRGRVRKCFFI